MDTDDARADEAAAPLEPAWSIAWMRPAVTSFGAAALGRCVYVLGGYHGRPHDYSLEGQVDAFLRLDSESGEWTALASPGRMQSVALVAGHGVLVRIGGMRALNTAQESERLTSIDEVARFDPRSGAWAALPALPAPRSSHMAASLGEQLYVAGGWTLDPDGDPRWCDDLLRLDPAASEPAWESLTMPFRRRALGVAAAAGHLFAIGGIDEEGEVSSRVDIHHPREERWSRGPDLPVPGFGVAAVGAHDRVWASARDGRLFSLGLGEASWRSHREWRRPRFFHQLVALDDGRLVCLGGISMQGRVEEVEVFDPSAPEDRGSRIARAGGE